MTIATAKETSQGGNDLEDFSKLLEETFGSASKLEGKVIKGTVIGVENGFAIIDVGLKSEGRIPLREFQVGEAKPEVKAGDVVEVYLERMEDRDGEVVLSREKARREAAWVGLLSAYESEEHVQGVMFSRVKGGFTVDLSGAIAFLPGSQVDVRPIRDVSALMGITQPFRILKMDRARGNIVVSRRAVLEETREAARSEILSHIEEGQVIKGIVKNVTDYGAFVDLGGVDGLLHVTDISWRRVSHPSEVLHIGQEIDVQIIKYNRETKRVSLGMKQLEADPWAGVDTKYRVGMRVHGQVTNVAEYGAFIELESGVEGLIHVSEMSWTKKNVHPSRLLSPGQEVEVMVLEVDAQKRRISLGLKQCVQNPWQDFADSHPVGTELEGEIKNITEFGLFVGLNEEIDGMVHASDLSWELSGEEALKEFHKGARIRVKILDVSVERERVSLGVKQLTADPFNEFVDTLKEGGIVTCRITSIQDNGIEIEIDEGVTGFIRKSELSRDRSEQRPDRFAVGEKVDAMILTIDRNARRLNLSIKALEVAEDKKAVAQFGSSDSGASLGDILGAALNKARDQEKDS